MTVVRRCEVPFILPEAYPHDVPAQNSPRCIRAHSSDAPPPAPTAVSSASPGAAVAILT